VAGKKKVYVTLPVGRTIALDVKESDTIEDIKRQIHSKEPIPVEQQDLVLRLSDEVTVGDISFRDEPFIAMFLMPIGMGKRDPDAESAWASKRF